METCFSKGFATRLTRTSFHAMEQNHAAFPCSLQWSGLHGDSQAESCARLPTPASSVLVCEMMCLVWVGFLELEVISGNHRLATLGKAKHVARDWQGQNSAAGSERGC